MSLVNVGRAEAARGALESAHRVVADVANECPVGSSEVRVLARVAGYLAQEIINHKADIEAAKTGHDGGGYEDATNAEIDSLKEQRDGALRARDAWQRDLEHEVSLRSKFQKQCRKLVEEKDEIARELLTFKRRIQSVIDNVDNV